MIWRALAIAFLAITAGCGAFSNASNPTPTATPAPVPEISTEPATPSGIAPGLAGGGVTNADRLAAAHLNGLEGTAYVWESERRVDRFPNETGAEHVVRTELRVESERRYWFYTDRRDTHNQRDTPFIDDVTEFADGERTYRRFVPFGQQEFTYRRGSVRRANGAYARELASPVRRYLAVPNATVAEVRAGGQRYYRVESQRPTAPGIAEGQNFSVTAIVAPDGVVHSLTASFERERRDRRERVEYSFTLDRRAAVAVERPDWVAEQWPADGPGSD